MAYNHAFFFLLNIVYTRITFQGFAQNHEYNSGSAQLCKDVMAPPVPHPPSFPRWGGVAHFIFVPLLALPL